MIASSIWGARSQLHAVISATCTVEKPHSISPFFPRRGAKNMLFEKHRVILVWNRKGKKQRNLGPTRRPHWQICKVFSVAVVHREYQVLKIIVICPISNYLSGLVTTGFGRAFHLVFNKRLQSPVSTKLLVAHWPKKRSMRITWHLSSRQGGRRILNGIVRGQKESHLFTIALDSSVWFVSVFFPYSGKLLGSS